MKEVGDKFGAGELILPFVLQSAEVMKRAVAQLEKYLDKLEGYTKGTVVIATVFGDVHDIGKSLVNTILTNNGYTVVDLGKQVPIGTILDAAQEHDATAIGLSRAARLDLQADAAVRPGAARARPRVPGADRRRRDQPRLRPARSCTRTARESDDIYEPGVFYCKDAFEGLAVMDQLVDADAREALVAKIRDEAAALREKPAEPEEAPPVTDDSVRSRRRTDNPIPTPPFWGAREIDVDLDEVYRHLDTHVLFKLHWGGRGVKGEAWQRARCDEDSSRGWSGCGASRTTCSRARCSATSPATPTATSSIVWDPEPTTTASSSGFVFPRQPKPRPDLPGRLLPPDGHGELDVVALQAVTAGNEVTELMAELERDGEFAEQLFVHGLGVQTAEGMAEWLHARARADLGIDPTQGRRYSWGYPACPEQSEHEKVFRLLDAPAIGLQPVRRLRGRARAVDARDRRPPPAGRVLRHEVGVPAQERAPSGRRADRRDRQGPDAAGRTSTTRTPRPS